MDATPRRRLRLRSLLGVGVLATGLLTAVGATPAGTAPAKHNPRFTEAVAFDVTQPLRALAKTAKASAGDKTARLSPEQGAAATAEDTGYSGDAAVQAASSAAAAAIRGTIANFEGLSNQDNFNVFGFRVNPPDPVGDVGPNHYVEMINLVFAVYSKTGHAAARAGRHRHAVGRLPDRRVHRALRRPDRHLRPVRRPLDPHPVHDPRPRLPRRAAQPFYNCVAISHDRRPDRLLLPVRVHAPASTSPTTRSTGCGGTRTSSPRASSASGRVDLRHRRLRARAQQDDRRATRTPAPSASCWRTAACRST